MLTRETQTQHEADRNPRQGKVLLALAPFPKCHCKIKRDTKVAGMGMITSRGVYDHLQNLIAVIL